MSEKNTPVTTPSATDSEVLKPSIIELLQEFQTVSKNLNPKKTSVRQIKRTLATLEAIITDLKQEVLK